MVRMLPSGGKSRIPIAKRARLIRQGLGCRDETFRPLQSGHFAEKHVTYGNDRE